MKTIKTIIVDDEAAARKSLSHFIQEYCPSIEIIGFGENIKEAATLIKQNEIDLVFLDIEMPRGTGFDLFDIIEKPRFETIFVTAFSQYAIQALNMSAAHYLLKPIDIDELIKAVNKVEGIIQEKSSINRTSILIENLKNFNNQKRKVVIPLMEGFEVVKMNEIIYMVADDNFVHIHLENETTFMACRSLKFYEEQLSEAGFMRIHRKYLINLEKVQRYLKGKSGFVVMENGKQLELSVSRKKLFLDNFKN